MFELRNYQADGIAQLSQYLSLASQQGARKAFVLATDRPYQSVRRLQRDEQDAGPPYVCLRIPTGGGKTLMACHAVGVAAKSFLHREQAVCLWLVPSNTIRDQTLEALRNRSHPYRQALQSNLSSTVRVMDLGEALSATRGMLDGDTVVIVTTLQSLRRDDTDGLRVYRENGRLIDVFSGRDHLALDGLERYEGGSESAVIPSLANALYMYRPVVVMDEAHRARTPLSFETLARFNPSCIVEFSATPETETDPAQELFASNVLYHVSAAALKAAEMIKLPVELRVQQDWKQLLSDAIAKLAALQKLAADQEAQGRQYLRPIMLLQAQPRREGRQTLSADVLKQSLMTDFQIPETAIAIATGDIRELEGVDLKSRACPIRFIITVHALREGWDCPFAYVLFTVAESRSSRAVEQLLGRVLRMPGAAKQETPALNRAYAFSSSDNWMEAAAAIKDAMVENGFERIEADRLVTPAGQISLLGPGSLYHQATATLSSPPALEALPPGLTNRVHYNGTTRQLTVTGSLNVAEVQAIREICPAPEDRQQIEEVVRTLADATPVQRDPAIPRQFKVPALAARIDGQRQLLQSSIVEVDWDPRQLDASLTEMEFTSQATAGAIGEVDISQTGRIEVNFIDRLQMQLALLLPETGWTAPKLCAWIDRQLLPHDDLTCTEATQYIGRVVEQLMQERGLSLETLAKDKFRLSEALRAKLDAQRQALRRAGFTAMLFPSSGPAQVEVSIEMTIDMDEDIYLPHWHYDGGYRWQKHAFNVVGELEPSGEEFNCAVQIDQMPQVLCWVRNVSRQYGSFWLPTSTDRFYPDFVVLLKDGRYVVVEYKNVTDWSNDDNREKRRIGELWEAQSAGKCLFVMPRGPDWPAISQKVAQ
jgi:type III restriction enzyme